MALKKTDHKQFKIWLKNLAVGTQYYWGEGTMFAVGNILVEYFTAACEFSPEFDTADFSWEPATDKIEEHELLCYVMQSTRGSVVKGLTKEPLGDSGSTFPSQLKGVASEVYLAPNEGDGDFARLMANVIFHEFLHNKLDAYYKGIGAVLSNVHTQAGDGLATGQKIQSKHRPTPRNLLLMGQNLSKKHAQYTGDLYQPDPEAYQNLVGQS